MTDHSIPIRQRWPALWRAGWIALFPPASQEPNEILRAQRHSQGLCIDCGKKAMSHRLRCVKHAAEQNRRTKECLQKKH